MAVRATLFSLHADTYVLSVVHPQLHFISHIPQNVKGEQLIAQLFRNIPTHSWLFKYGCVPMSFVMGEWIWEVRASPLRAARRANPRAHSASQRAARPSHAAR